MSFSCRSTNSRLAQAAPSLVYGGLLAGRVVLEPFTRLTRPESAALENDAADVTRSLAS